MKFITNTSTLLRALSFVSPAVSVNKVIDILDHFLFEVTPGKLKLTANNLDFSIAKEISIESNFTYGFAIPSAKILTLLKNLPDQPLTFEVKVTEAKNSKKIQAHINTGNGNFIFSCEPGEDFPTSITEAENAVSILSEDLLEGIYKTLFAASKDDLRPKLCGVNIEFTPGKIKFTSTDAYVLSTTTLESNIKEPGSLLIPAKILSLIQSIKPTGEIQICYSQNNIIFKLNEGVIVARLIDEKPPEYTSVIGDNEIKVSIDKDMLSGAVRRATPFSFIGLVRLDISATGIGVSADNIDFDEHSKEDITATGIGVEPFAIGCNGNQLLSCLSRCVTGVVDIYFSTANRAFLIREDGQKPNSKENLMLVMPLQLSN